MSLLTMIIIGVVIMGIGTLIITYAPIIQAKRDQEIIPESGRISKIISWKVKEPCIANGSAKFIWAGERGQPMIAGEIMLRLGCKMENFLFHL